MPLSKGRFKVDKDLMKSLALGFDPSSSLLPLFSVCRNHTPKHKTRLEYGVFVEAAALFLSILFQQLTLEKVIPIDTCKEAFQKGPGIAWEWCQEYLSAICEAKGFERERILV